MAEPKPTFRVLGPLEVSGERETVEFGPRRRLLLALLLVNRGGAVSADALADALWPDGVDRVAALHTQISRLRRWLADQAPSATVVTAPEGYRLEVPAVDVDACRFERFRAQAAGAADPATTADVLRTALSLWRGPAYGDLAEVDLVRPEAMRLDELRLATIEDRHRALLAAGRAGEVVPELQAFVSEHPLREEAAGLLMRALYATGRQSDALRHYQRHRRYLGEELGIEPSAALQRLESEILTQDLDVAETPRSVRRSAPATLDELALEYVRRPDGAAVATATLGEGPRLLSVPAWVTSLEVIGAGRDPRSSLLERLARHVRLTMYDRLGTGLSPGEVDDFSLQATVDELLAVLDHVGPAALLAVSQAGPAAVTAAVRRPDLVTHLVLFGTFADAATTFVDERATTASVELVRASWGLGSRLFAGLYRPGASDDVADHLARVMRESAPGEVAAGYLAEMYRTDVSELASSVTTPTVVLHYTKDRVVPFRGGRQLAAGVPGAVFVPLEGRFHLPDVADLDRIVTTIVEFVSS